MNSPTTLTHAHDVNPHTQHFTLAYKHDLDESSKGNFSNATFELPSGNFASENFSANYSDSNFTGGNYTGGNFTGGNLTEYAEIPYYIRATSMSFCIAIMCLGVVGNVLVPVVILRTKDMRNSTNIFLVNLSVADLLVLLVCTPTVLLEVGSKPDTWLLGRELCLAVPFVELTVTHASVLTILAISFERYYAICEPLRAGYVCTKTRATLICALVWFFAALFTSPILGIAEHHEVRGEDGSVHAQCLTQAVTFWPVAFFLMNIILLYLLPLIILIVLYSVIAKNLITAASKIVMNKTFDPCNARARKQVILMLGTVVLCFFLCLMPYRALTLWIIITPAEFYDELSPEKWYNILYFSRVMLYLNSAINPILYNLMSSKFRLGFCKVCICYKKSEELNRRVTRTITNGSTTSSTLTRTTNSLKKLFGHRSSVDKSDGNESENKDEVERRSLFGRIFSNKTFIRQQSAPVCSTGRPTVINRMRSEGSMPVCGPLVEDIIGHSSSRVEESSRTHSLRRSVLINSAKAKSVDSERKVCYQQIKVDCVVAFQKSKSVDYDLPESFV